MADLKDLEKRLNADPELRQAFVNNPAKHLKAEGVPITAAQTRELKAELTKLKLKPADLELKRARVRIIIKIGIGVSRTASR